MATLACVPDKSFLLVLVAIVSLFACWASHFGPSMVSKLLYDALLWGCQKKNGHPESTGGDSSRASRPMKLAFISLSRQMYQPPKIE